MSNIAIIGYGKVGQSLESFLNKHHNCIIYDAFIESYAVRDRIQFVDIAIICINTPPRYLSLMPGNSDHSCDISDIDDIMAWINSPLTIIKSTVAPGSCLHLKTKHGKRIVYSPEFCDLPDKHFFIFGGDAEDTKQAVNLFNICGGPDKKYIQTDLKSAEMVKYLHSSYFANKLAFCKQMSIICEKIGIDYNVVRELWLNDERVSSCHTIPQTIDPTVKKDLAAFEKYSDSELIKEINHVISQK